ncbi:MAG: hypothetical protein WA364_24230 [Candidatus Nitrosopolaris sp.]
MSATTTTTTTQVSSESRSQYKAKAYAAASAESSLAAITIPRREMGNQLEGKIAVITGGGSGYYYDLDDDLSILTG